MGLGSLACIPENLGEMKLLRPHPRPTELGTMGVSRMRPGVGGPLASGFTCTDLPQTAVHC